MSSFKNIAFTAQALAARPLMEQLSRVVAQDCPDAIVLREKTISDEEYLKLARDVQTFCAEQGIDFFCNGHVEQARAIGCRNIQLGMADLECHVGRLGDFKTLWVSVHSSEEAARAQELGANAIIFGHVYLTDCKKGLPARGLDQLQEIVQAFSIPVYGIGGIEAKNFIELQQAGAAGACRMSYFMGI